MIFRYWFGPDGDEEEFEYELSVDEIKEFCEELAKNISFNSLDCACTDAEIENPYETPDEFLEESKDEIADFLYQSDLWKEWEDDAKEYFCDAAEEAYQDQEEYDRDPLGYFGMSWRDFL